MQIIIDLHQNKRYELFSLKKDIFTYPGVELETGLKSSME
jgi:hypothetical protein